MPFVPSGPDFISIGMQKTGTAWLYEQLQRHPAVWMPPVKEIHYLDASRRHRRADVKLQRILGRGLDVVNEQRARQYLRPLEQRDLDFYTAWFHTPQEDADLSYYEKLFAAKGDQLTGDITPAYSTLPPERVQLVARRFPAVRIILGIRDPIDRFWSTACQYVERRRLLGRFDHTDWPAIQHLVLAERSVARSHPTQIAATWRRFVPEEQFKIIFFDDLRRDAAAVRNDVLLFLGLDPQQFPAEYSALENKKAAALRLDMPDAIHERLVEHFGSEVRACAATFGGPALDWPRRHGLA
jgi:hypothetical protein